MNTRSFPPLLATLSGVIKAQVEQAFLPARDRIEAGGRVMGTAGASGRAAMDNFRSGLRDGYIDAGKAIIRCAEKPVDERIKMRA